MNGKDIYALGKNSPEARATVPLSLVHTPPRLIFDETWYAEFWYFLQTFNGKNISISAPRFRLIFELPAKRLVKLERFENNGKEPLGVAPELATKEFYSTLNDYLNFCGYVTAKTPEAQTLAKAYELWRKTLPEILRTELEKTLSNTNVANATITANAEKSSDVLVENLEQYLAEVAQAIENGDQLAYDVAKKKYDKAKARK